MVYVPPVNIYTSREKVKALESALPKIRAYIAQTLSCRGRRLADNEISLRVIVPDASVPIADTELEIKAHGYHERVQRQDESCLLIRNYVQRTCPKAGSAYVWLQLSELGHSAKE